VTTTLVVESFLSSSVGFNLMRRNVLKETLEREVGKKLINWANTSLSLETLSNQAPLKMAHDTRSGEECCIVG
jgi:hypothetical protein